MRIALRSDCDRCNEICHAVHGHTPAGEIEAGVREELSDSAMSLAKIAARTD